MRLATYLATAAMLMTTVPAAAANPAASLSVGQPARVGSPAARKSELAGNLGIIIPVVVLIALIATIIGIEDSGSPKSP